MEKKHREKIRNTGKTQGILSRLKCGHPDYVFSPVDIVFQNIFTVSIELDGFTNKETWM